MSFIDMIAKTGKKMERAVNGSKSGTDVLDTLKEEHDEVQALLKQLVDSESGSERKSLLKKIKAALVPHVRAEEKAVYDAIIALKKKDAKIDGNEGYLEHALADKMLANLGKITNAMSPEFSAAAKVLKELVEHHIQEEERNVWSDVRENFSLEQREEMNRRFLMGKKKVRVN
jgi:hypothetical protein